MGVSCLGDRAGTELSHWGYFNYIVFQWVSPRLEVLIFGFALGTLRGFVLLGLM